MKPVWKQYQEEGIRLLDELHKAKAERDEARAWARQMKAERDYYKDAVGLQDIDVIRNNLVEMRSIVDRKELEDLRAENRRLGDKIISRDVEQAGVEYAYALELERLEGELSQLRAQFAAVMQEVDVRNQHEYSMRTPTRMATPPFSPVMEED